MVRQIKYKLLHVTQQVECKHRDENRQSWKHHDVVGHTQVAPVICEHRAPLRTRRLRAKTDEAQHLRLK
jgi:hypothetical protein